MAKNSNFFLNEEIYNRLKGRWDSIRIDWDSEMLLKLWHFNYVDIIHSQLIIELRNGESIFI